METAMNKKYSLSIGIAKRPGWGWNNWQPSCHQMERDRTLDLMLECLHPATLFQFSVPRKKWSFFFCLNQCEQSQGQGEGGPTTESPLTN